MEAFARPRRRTGAAVAQSGAITSKPGMAVAATKMAASMTLADLLQSQRSPTRKQRLMPETMFDKIWDAHFVARRADGRDLIYIDRHVLHELHAPHAFEQAGEAAAAGAPSRPDILDAGSHGRDEARTRRDHQPGRRGVLARDA